MDGPSKSPPTALDKALEREPHGQIVKIPNPPAPTPMTLLAMATEQGADLDKLEKLMDLQERWEANEQRKAYAAAMAEFQGKAPLVFRSKTAKGKRFDYDYASLDDIMRAVRPLMLECGFSVTFDIESSPTTVKAICTLTHRLGFTKDSSWSAPVDADAYMNDTQKIASANSYARRYAFMNAFNIVLSNEDDDAHMLSGDKLGAAQLATIEDHIKEIKDQGDFNLPKFLEYVGGFASLEEIPASKYGFVRKQLLRKLTSGPKATRPVDEEAKPQPTDDAGQDEEDAKVNDKQETKQTVPSGEVQVVILSVETEKGMGKNNKPYTRYKIFCSDPDGLEFMTSTFSKTAATKAEEYADSGKTATVELKDDEFRSLIKIS